MRAAGVSQIGAAVRLLFARAAITVTVGARYPLEEAAAAMARIHRGTHGAAVALTA